MMKPRGRSPVTQQTYHARVLRVQQHIEAHLDESLSIEDLARIANFSAFHFHRIFKGVVGESLMTHVRRLRLERAAHDLALTQRSIVQVGRRAGYDSQEAFTRAFLAHFGITPAAFRTQQRPVDPRQESNVHGTLTDAEGRPQWPDVRVVEFEPIRVAYMRHIGPYPGAARTWMAFSMWAGQQGWPLERLRKLAIAYDDPEITPEAHLRYDACIEIDEHLEPAGEVGVQTIVGGTYAVLTHHGPYMSLGETYARLYGAWLPASGRDPRDHPSVLHYLTPMVGIPQDQLRTDVCVPVESVSAEPPTTP